MSVGIRKGRYREAHIRVLGGVWGETPHTNHTDKSKFEVGYEVL